MSMTNTSITIFDLFTIYWSCNLFPAILHGDGQFCYHFDTLLHYLVKWCIHSRAGSGQFLKVQQVMLLSLKKVIVSNSNHENWNRNNNNGILSVSSSYLFGLQEAALLFLMCCSFLNQNMFEKSPVKVT